MIAWPHVSEDEDSDVALLAAWREGDAAAGQALLATHFSRLYMFFSNKVAGDVSDLVQRTMLGCVEGRDRIGGSFKAYLLGVARKQLYAHYRGTMAAAGRDAATTTVADLSPTPSAMVVMKHDQRRLLTALRNIPLEFQIVVELHYWEDLSMPELAEVLGVPVGTAKSRLRRAREALAAKVRETESTPLGETTMDNVDRWARSIRAEIAVQLERG